jgi:hypothetical protein
MSDTRGFGAIWSAYMKAVNAHASAASVLQLHVLARTKPTANDIQREADTRVIMIGARTAYLEARDE